MRFLVVVLLFVTAGGCGSSTPTAPDANRPSAASYAGVWQIEYRVTECNGDRHCPAFLGTIRRMVLRLAQSGSMVSGVASGDITVDVTGTVAGDGSVTLTGLKRAMSPRDTTGEVEVRELMLRQSPPAQLTGSLDYEIRYTPTQNFETARTKRVGEITSSTRLATDAVAASVQGRWVGYYVIRACVVTGWPNCFGEEERVYPLLDFNLVQAGSSVTGTISMGMPVSLNGQFSGGALTLNGEGKLPGSGGFTVVRIPQWTATVDALGRMSGKFTFVREAHFTVGVSAGNVYTQTFDAELFSVVPSL
jgi:hypothetical protein